MTSKKQVFLDISFVKTNTQTIKKVSKRRQHNKWTWTSPTVMRELRNRKHFPCFHTVIEKRVEVWENEKLQLEHEPARQVFPRYFAISSVSITYGNTEKKCFLFLL